MFLIEGIYFVKYFFSCSMFDKWTAKENLFHVDLSRTISHEHYELCITSEICCLASHPALKISLRFAFTATVICF